MKRTPLRRSKPLTRKQPLKVNTPLKRSAFQPKPPSKTTAKAPGTSSTARKAMIEWLDDALRKIVKREGKCVACGIFPGPCQGPLEAAHVHSRRHWAIRWHEDNLLPLCKFHHQMLHNDEDDLIFLLVSEKRYERLREIRDLQVPIMAHIEAEKERVKARLKEFGL